MMRYLAKRLAWGLLVMSTVITVVFVLVVKAGDPAATTLGPRASVEQIQDFRRNKGLDQPFAFQFGSYLGITPCVRRDSPRYGTDSDRGHCGILQGDLGESYLHHEPVARVIGYRLPRTLLLGVMAMFFELVFGLGAGIVAALRRNTWTDTGLMFGTFLGISLPTYVSGPLVLLLFGFLLGWFPVGGYGVTTLDHLHHAVLPALVLAVAGAATYARLLRSELVETLRHDYVRTARAKGLPEGKVVFKHAVRNAMLPVATVLGLSFPALVSGAIITEKVFAWPGLGLLTIESIYNLDVPMVMAVVLMFAITVQVGNFLADLAVAALDPRIRLGERS
jgi:peptide/nickel transport system permease protein